MQQKEILIHNIRWLRRKHGLSYRRMARMLGISTWTMFLMEQGYLSECLGMEVLFCLECRFRIPIADLFRKHLGES